jgi:hypothetical protein
MGSVRRDDTICNAGSLRHLNERSKTSAPMENPDVASGFD